MKVIASRGILIHFSKYNVNSYNYILLLCFLFYANEPYIKRIFILRLLSPKKAQKIIHCKDIDEIGKWEDFLRSDLICRDNGLYYA